MKQSKDNGVLLVNPDGKLVTVSNEESVKALGLGYRNASADDISVHNYTEENKGLSGAVKVGLNQMVNQLAFNVPETVMDYSDSDLEKAKRNAIKKDHNIANAIGGIVGFGGSMVYGGPVTSGATKLLGAGSGLVGRAIANRLGNAAIEAGAAKIAEQTLTKTGIGMAGSIARSGTEGALMMAPQAATEAYFGDHEQAAESLLAGGLFGLAVGSGVEALKGVVKGGSYFTKQAGEKLGLKGQANELASRQATEEQGVSLLEQAIKDRPAKEAAKINEAATRLGITPTTGMLSENPLIRGTESSLSQSPTLFGQKVWNELNAVIKKSKEHVETILSPKAEKSLKESGDDAQKLLSSELMEKQMELNTRYNWIDENLGHLPVDQDLKQFAVDKLASSDNVRLNLSREPLEVAKSVDAIQNFNDAKIVRTSTRQRSSALSNSLDRAALNDAYGELTNLRNKAVERLDDAASPVVAQAKQTVKETDAMYRETMERFKPIDEALGGRESKSVQDVLDKITDSVDAQKFTGKLFNTSELSRLQKIKETFPEVFEVLKSQKMADIYQKSITGTELNVKKFIKQIDALPREVQEMMFGKEFGQKLSDLRTVIYSLPEKMGPSGTPQGLDFLKIMEVGMQLRDFGRYTLLKTGQYHNVTKALPFIEQGLKQTAKHLDNIDRVLVGDRPYIGPTGKQVMTGAISRILYGHEDNKDHTDNFDKVSDQLTSMNQNPTANPGTISFGTALSANGAPNIANLYQQQMQTALKYLYEQMPKDPNPPSMFGGKKWTPSDAQLAKFNRVVNSIDNPFSVIKDFQDGKITKEQVMAVQTVYPKIYAQIQKRVVNHMASNDLSKLPFNKKIQVGILLNNPTVVSSINHVGAYQANFNTLAAHQDLTGQMPAPKGVKNVKFDQSKNIASDVNRVMYRH